jgi:hypothetical protein
MEGQITGKTEMDKRILCINLGSFYYMKVQEERWERNK